MARFGSLGQNTFSGRKPYILFLCTGNTCRSPMAMGVLLHYMKEAGVDNLEVRTAGVMTIPGLMPTQECRQLLLKDGIDISFHRSCQLTAPLIERAHLVLGMTSFHVQSALRLSEQARAKTFLLKEFTGCEPKNGQIQDPMGCTLEVYKRVYREIKAACRKLAKMDLLRLRKADSRSHRRQATPAAKAEPKAAATKGGAASPPAKVPGKSETPKPATKAAAAKTAPEKSAAAKGGARSAAKAAATKPAPATPEKAKAATPKPKAAVSKSKAAVSKPKAVTAARPKSAPAGTARKKP